MENKIIFVVTSYQNIVGCYESMDDAADVAKQTIAKNRPANIATIPLTPKSN